MMDTDGSGNRGRPAKKMLIYAVNNALLFILDD